MAVTTNAGAPTVIEAGDYYIFTETFQPYPANAWNMSFVLQAEGGGTPITTQATAVNTTSFQCNLNTSGFNPGRYSMAEYVTEIASGQRATAKTGVVQVIPDLTQALPMTTAATMLANINSAIQQLTLRPMISVSVNNVSYTRADITMLIRMRTQLQAEVLREQAAADAFRGVETSGRISTRFQPQTVGTPFFSKDIGQ